MRAVRLLLLLSLLAANLGSLAFAGTSVWKVEKNGSHIFLGGTVHLLTPNDYPLPKAFDIAYQQADKLVFEANIADLETEEFQIAMMQMLSYPDGQNLKLNLSTEAYQTLERYCKSRGIAIEGLLPFKPSMVSMILTITELERLGFTGEGVDVFYSKKAQADNKQTGELETAEQQLSFITQMGLGQEDDLIIYSLKEMDKLPQVMESIMVAWRSGDLEQLEAVATEAMKQEFPDVHHNLIVKRNNTWMPKIEAMFRTKPVEFVLVGSLHLSGETGLINQLKARGYQVEMLGE